MGIGGIKSMNLLPWIGYTRLDRKNKVCKINKNILEDFLCRDVNEEPIQKKAAGKAPAKTAIKQASFGVKGVLDDIKGLKNAKGIEK
ncbi:hypothetical protein ACQ3MN_07805 [Enterococcus faecalis]|uniref:hypothetical protein n=1 Tax=Enterococcus faecalis TaxID=1351 RepID=UPI003D77EE28